MAAYAKRSGREEDLAALQEKYTVIVVKWADTWPPDNLSGDSEHIRLKWPEDI